MHSPSGLVVDTSPLLGKLTHNLDCHIDLLHNDCHTFKFRDVLSSVLPIFSVLLTGLVNTNQKPVKWRFVPHVISILNKWWCIASVTILTHCIIVLIGMMICHLPLVYDSLHRLLIEILYHSCFIVLEYDKAPKSVFTRFSNV